MLPEGSVRADGVWKRFKADPIRRTFRDQSKAIAGRVTGKGGRGHRWALRDINIDVPPGASVGLIGANGSGKSTMLKILTRVMYPTAGTVTVMGRVGALIEVRAGIHPELTGRENVYLYGSLMGLSRAQVAERFDDIVGFAELDAAIDRQVKFYSSGMQMRLGFGVAAFLEPHVLLVDEVLAVGDAAFQQRCLDRMRHVLAQGTTLVLVSHDLAAVEATCERGIWLDKGVIRAMGPVREVIGEYRRSVEAQLDHELHASGALRVTSAVADGVDGGPPASQRPLDVTIALEATERISGRLYLGVSEGTATPIFVVSYWLELEPGTHEVRCHLGDLPLPAGRYFVYAGVIDRVDDHDVVPWHPITHVDLFGPGLDPTPVAVVRLAPVLVSSGWELDRT